MKSSVSGNPLIKCEECGEHFHSLVLHVVNDHRMSRKDYEAKHPDKPLHSKDVELQTEEFRVTPVPFEPAVKFAGQTFPVNTEVPPQDCLPLPAFYRVPEAAGSLLAEAVTEVAIAFKCKRSVYVHGPPGSGKDAFMYAYSALTRTPALKFQVIPGTDIQPWFYSRSLNQEGSFWEEGSLLKALRDGYELPSGGRIPYMILITDWDRATRQQAEWLRMVLDSIEGRVPGPRGVTYPIFPGTTVVATGNTAGGGDPKARMISANPMDASIQERWERSFYFDWMRWEDEFPVIRQKFPLLDSRCSHWWDNVKEATEKLREEIAADKLYMEFSHRSLCSWLGHAQDILTCLGEDQEVPENLLKRGAHAFLTRISDPYTRTGAINTINPFIPGGMT